MAADRSENLPSPPVSAMEPDNAGEVSPRSPANLSVFNDENPLIPAFNDGGTDSTEFIANRSDPITAAKLSLVIIAQTAAIILSGTSAARTPPILAAVLILGYGSGVSAVWLSRNNRLLAGVMGQMSTACAGISFAVTVGLVLPQKLFWVVVFCCLVLFSAFVTSCMN